MKKIISIAAISVLTLSLFGCQYFQPPAEEPVMEEEEAAGETATQTATLEITEGEEAVDQEAALTITEGDDDEMAVEVDVEGMLDQPTTIEITESDDDDMAVEEETTLMVE